MLRVGVCLQLHQREVRGTLSHKVRAIQQECYVSNPEPPGLFWLKFRQFKESELYSWSKSQSIQWSNPP